MLLLPQNNSTKKLNILLKRIKHMVNITLIRKNNLSLKMYMSSRKLSQQSSFFTQFEWKKKKNNNPQLLFLSIRKIKTKHIFTI